jgi:hypothetical protein
MNIYEIINNLYTNRSTKWILDLEDNEIEPFVIQRFLCMNDGLRIQVRWLDKYIFDLPPKMYLSLAWSVIPKLDRAPFINYIKKQTENNEFDFIFKKIRQHFSMADNDFRIMKSRLLDSIKKDFPNWFGFYGIEKVYWKRYSVDFNLIKNFGVEKNKCVSNDLSKWGL